MCPLHARMCCGHATGHLCACRPAGLKAELSAWRLLQVKHNITICATIHCPPPHTFLLFDKALIMQRGSVIYFGRNGAPCQQYFTNFGKVGQRLC